eukprot:1193723-Prorocentrum_minimum.AAC.1
MSCTGGGFTVIGGGFMPRAQPLLQAQRRQRVQRGDQDRNVLRRAGGRRVQRGDQDRDVLRGRVQKTLSPGVYSRLKPELRSRLETTRCSTGAYARWLGGGGGIHLVDELLEGNHDGLVVLLQDELGQEGHHLALQVGRAQRQHLEQLLRQRRAAHQVVQPAELAQDQPRQAVPLCLISVLLPAQVGYARQLPRIEYVNRCYASVGVRRRTFTKRHCRIGKRTRGQAGCFTINSGSFSRSMVATCVCKQVTLRRVRKRLSPVVLAPCNKETLPQYQQKSAPEE